MVSNGDLSGDHNHDQHLVSNIKMVYPPSSSQQCDVHNLVCKINLNVDPWCDLLSSVSITMNSAIDRFNTLYRGSALYPHHGTHGLALPFGCTNGVPTKLIYCYDTLPATQTHSPLGWSWVAPCLLKTQRPLSWSVPNRDQSAYHPTTGTQGYVCLPGEGTHAHNHP